MKMKMKILVLQIEDRNDNFLNKLMKSNRIICNNNDIEYVFLKKSNQLVPPYWAKIYEIKRLLYEHSDVDYIIWIDSDAFFINFTKDRLINFLNKYNTYSFIGTNNMPPWQDEKFNAGVFIVKNNNIGKNIINKWITYYHKDVWTYDEETKKWDTQAKYAGEEYEEGSFIKYILEDKNLVKDIKILPYYYLNNNNCNDYQDETLLVHLAATHKKDENNVAICTKKLINNDINENFIDTSKKNILMIILLIFLVIIVLIILVIIYKYYKYHNVKINGKIKIK
jgi:hypothetical protein